MKEFSMIHAITFDCYGTLIDWETGILSALRPMLLAHGITPEDDDILQQYARYESQWESPPYRTYREVLRGVVRSTGDAYGFLPSADEEQALERSLTAWKPFEDTIPALQKLQERHTLAVISNVDDDLFAATTRGMEIVFAHVITSMQVRSYKPSRENFLHAIERLQFEPSQILHVAQSRFHDIPPAKSCGMKTVWINRRGLKGGSGATLPSEVTADLELPDLKSLVPLMG